MSGANNTGSTEGAAAADDLKTGAKQAYGATEQLRNGINSFFDSTLQPSAAKDAAHGETARHKNDPRANTDADMLTTGTKSTSGVTGAGGEHSGFSNDAKKLGQSLKDALTSDSSHTKDASTGEKGHIHGSSMGGETTGIGGTATGSSGTSF